MDMQMTVAQAVREAPWAIDVLNDFHIDYCCGGHRSLKEALEEKNIDPATFVDLLNRQAKQRQQTLERLDIKALETLAVPELIDHIVAAYHGREETLLAEIDELMLRVLKAHYAHHHAQLIPLHKTVHALRGELQAHFVKEEQLVFPLMRHPNPTRQDVALVEQLEGEHEAAGELLKQIDGLTGHYAPPDDACASYIRLFEQLKALSEDIYLHIFSENAILFPKYEKEAQHA